jgi:uncharacterized repeat protein (TIGR02543 family)
MPVTGKTERSTLKVFLRLAAVLLVARPASGVVVINEVCYDNESVADETGDVRSDWIELYNRGPGSVNVGGYGLGDVNPYQESQGVRLPDHTLLPGEFLVVFASADRPEYTAWVKAPDRPFVAENAVWRYRSAAEAPPGSWPSPAFDDSQWGAGISPLGYNDAKQDMDCATVLDGGPQPSARHPAAYFRTAFAVVNPSAVTGLVLRARVDDGAVVYLNGAEILRENMPPGPVAHETLALSSVPSTRWITARLAADALRTGTNVLAVEVHQALTASPDLIMDMTLTGLTDATAPVVHGQFRLANEGENVHLFNAELTRVHLFAPPGLEIGENRSFGALPDGNTSTFAVFNRPTPGLPNAAHPFRYSETLTAETPVFSVAPGRYGEEQVVALRTPTGGLRIYYTLDGTDPKTASTFVMSGGSVRVRAAEAVSDGLAWRRTNPPEMDNSVLAAAWRPPAGTVVRSVVLRAVAVDAGGIRCSPEARGTYLIGPRFQELALPVVSLISDPDGLFGFAEGIYVPGKTYADSGEGFGENRWGRPYANYFQSNADRGWERAAHFELFEPGRRGASVSLALGAAVTGGSMRALPQKTIELLARGGEYGTNQIGYALFPGEAVAAYRRVLLHNGGNDWYGPESGGVATMLKDAVFQELVKPLTLPAGAHRPVIVCLNGEYWGLHQLRESLDKHYFAAHYGLDPDNVDLLEQEESAEDVERVTVTVDSGDPLAADDYRALLDWVQANTLQSDANFRQLQTRMDVANYTDCVIAQTFFASADWPANEGLLWRAHTNQTAEAGSGDTRWRWALGDLDRAGARGSDFDMLTHLAADPAPAVDSPRFLIRSLWKNAGYRGLFVERYERLLNTVFSPGRTAARIAAAAETVAPEMETHFRRWGRPVTRAQWRQAVDAALVRFAAERHAVLWRHLDDRFSLGGSGLLTVRNAREDGAGGSFEVGGIAIDGATPGVTGRAAWSGRFFANRTVTVRAVPDAGYVFGGWTGRAETQAVLEVRPGGGEQVFVAVFLPGEAGTCIVTLDPGGGEVEPASVTVPVGGVYGALPVPLRAGYTFAGWWTGEGGTGVQVVAGSPVAAAGDHAVYARWLAAEEPGEAAATVGVAFNMALPEAFAGAGGITVKGVPSGMRYDKNTRALTGVATRPGTYPVVVSAAGLSAQTVTVAVAGLPVWARGSFNGYLDHVSGGQATMSVTEKGRITGKLAFGARNYTFSASSYAGGGEAEGGFSVGTTVKSGAASFPLALRIEPSGRPVLGTEGAMGIASGHLGGLPLVLYRDLWKDPGTGGAVSRYTGYYTATLPGGAAYGSGFLAFTVDKAGRVKTAGKLADGTRVSMAGMLVADATGGVFTVMYAAPAAYKGGGVFGLAEFVSPDGGEVAVRVPDGASVLWTSSNPSATESYGEGFGRQLTLSGGWYSKTGDLYDYYAGRTLALLSDAGAAVPELTVGTNRHASAWWRPDGVMLVPVLRSGVMNGLTAAAAGKPVDAGGGEGWDYGAGNTVGLKISLTRATGIFKGSFKAWFDYFPNRHVSKTLTFQGALTPVRENPGDGIEGRGYFLWPDKAAVPATGRLYRFQRSYDFMVQATE